MHGMKKSHLFLITVFMLAGSVNLMAQKVKGNGNVVKKERSVGTFSEIQSFGSFDITITDGATTKVEVEAEDNLQEFIEVSVQGDKLQIKSRKNQNFNATKSINIYVTVPSLRAIGLHGSGNVKSENLIRAGVNFEIKSAGSGNVSLEVETTNLSADIAGSGNITLKGKTKEFEGRIQGSGNIRARDMQSEITTVKIAGSGNAEVVATSKLNTNIAGSGDVKYWGDASVDSKVAGSGSVRREK
jgi:hypothetical protein